jgi:hypothetical protein
MNDDAFYGMIPDAIGYVSYKWKGKSKPMSNQEEQDFIDNYTREALNVLLTKATYSYEDIPNPLVAHFNARQDARRILDSMGPSVELLKTDLQVGNAECLTYVKKLEADSCFRGWVNPGLIQLYIQTTKSLLKSQK